jgi:Ankyrin repeats (3 copies)
VKKAGAKVNAQGEWYGTALQIAVRFGFEETAKLLVEADADVNAEAGWFEFALTAASSHGHEDIVQLLLKHDAKEKEKQNHAVNAVDIIDDKYWLPGYLKPSPYGRRVTEWNQKRGDPPPSGNPAYLHSRLVDTERILGALVVLSNDGLNVTHSDEDNDFTMTLFPLHNPIPPSCGEYYFEVDVVDKGKDWSNTQFLTFAKI